MATASHTGLESSTIYMVRPCRTTCREGDAQKGQVTSWDAEWLRLAAQGNSESFLLGSVGWGWGVAL